MSLNPRDAVIVDYARSAMGRSKNGCFRHTRGDTISAEIINGLLSAMGGRAVYAGGSWRLHAAAWRSPTAMPPPSTMIAALIHRRAASG